MGEPVEPEQDVVPPLTGESVPDRRKELPAALARVDIQEDGSSLDVICDCCAFLYSTTGGVVNLLNLVELALEHRHACPRA